MAQKEGTMKTVAAFIQARTGSTRLPGKVLLPLEGKTVLERVIERVRHASKVTEAVVVTTLSPQDLPIVRLCAEAGVRVFCGSEDDVLDRFYQAARLVKPDHVVRITSDCPLMDPSVIDLVVERHLAAGAAYTTNTSPETYPDGEDVEVFTAGALDRAWREARLQSEREHVTPYIRNHPELFALESVRHEPDLSRQRWTLDNPEDYAFISRVYAALHGGSPFFGMEAVLGLIRADPSITDVNAGIGRNEGYEKSLREDKEVKGD
jgi:spore coat polysaccharide biosynthesis protein SpsF (cytidylyltransferase family)